MITENIPVDLDSPRRELFIRGLEFIVALLVRWQIVFLSARIGRPFQLYAIALGYVLTNNKAQSNNCPEQT